MRGGVTAAIRTANRSWKQPCSSQSPLAQRMRAVLEYRNDGEKLLNPRASSSSTSASEHHAYPVEGLTTQPHGITLDIELRELPSWGFFRAREREVGGGARPRHARNVHILPWSMMAALIGVLLAMLTAPTSCAGNRGWRIRREAAASWK